MSIARCRQSPRLCCLLYQPGDFPVPCSVSAKGRKARLWLVAFVSRLRLQNWQTQLPEIAIYFVF